MEKDNPIRRFLRAPLTAPLAWVLNLATSALYFRKSPHATIALAVFGAAILGLLVMLVFAMKRKDRKSFERVTEYAALCFLVESSLLLFA